LSDPTKEEESMGKQESQLQHKLENQWVNYLQIDRSDQGSLDIQLIIGQAKRSFRQPFFMEVVIVACWHIWLIRNAAIFRGKRPIFARWKASFIHDMYMLQYRIKAKFRPSLLAWLGSLH
jgi:hypothetical protein